MKKKEKIEREEEDAKLCQKKLTAREPWFGIVSAPWQRRRHASTGPLRHRHRLQRHVNFLLRGGPQRVHRAAPAADDVEERERGRDGAIRVRPHPPKARRRAHALHKGAHIGRRAGRGQGCTVSLRA